MTFDIGDIGNLTYGVRANTTDLAEIFNNAPWRRREFGDQEVADLRETALKLNLLLSAIDVSRQPAPKLVYKR